METGISRRLAVALGAALVALTGCGGSSGQAAETFGWLKPSPPPRDWKVLRIPNGASMAYPPGWRRIKSDPGTATAAQLGPTHNFTGYLNITPLQGDETLSNYGGFRIAHNLEEHDRQVQTLGVRQKLHFRTGRGTCIRDSYATESGSHYVELACLVSGRRATTAIVGAAPPQAWARISPLLERAISSMTT